MPPFRRQKQLDLWKSESSLASIASSNKAKFQSKCLCFKSDIGVDFASLSFCQVVL